MMMGDISPSLKNGTAVALGDGSFKSRMGTAGFALEGPCCTKHRIIGINRVPGSQDVQSPYRSELSSLLGILVLVSLIYVHYGVTKGCIVIACNCKSTLNHAVNTCWQVTSQSAILTSYPLFTLSWRPVQLSGKANGSRDIKMTGFIS